jgi:hypothetical protein
MLDSSHRSLRRALTAALSALLLCATTSHAQLPAPPLTTEDALHQMLDQSGIVFTGQVTAVDHNNAAILEVTFAVDDAIFGVAPNSTYTLREWAAVSPAEASQFEIGRRYLMFLHAAGPGGLSSPVGGPDGAIPILPGNEAASLSTPDVLGFAAQTAIAQAAAQATAQLPGNTPATAPLSPAHTTFRVSPASQEITNAFTAPVQPNPLASSSVDLRWIATRVLAPVDYVTVTASPAEARPIVVHGNMLSPGTHLIDFAAQSATRTVAEISGSSAPDTTHQPTSSATYSGLLTTLRAWHEAAQQEARASR